MYRVLCFVLNKLKVFQRFGVNLLLEMAALLRFLDLIYRLEMSTESLICRTVQARMALFHIRC